MAKAEYKRVMGCSLEQLKKTIWDIESYPTFLDGLKKATIVKETKKIKKVAFELSLIKVFHYTLSITNDGDRIHWTMDDGDLFKKNDGEWQLKSVDSSHVEACYKIDVDLKLTLPDIMAKKLASANLPRMFDQFEKKARGSSS